MSLSKKIDYQDKKTIEYLKKQLKALKTKRILLYCPMEFEVDIYPLIYWLKRHKGIRIFVPRINKVSFKMVPFRLVLDKNEYNIFEARDSLFYLTKIDTAIVPVLGVDKKFKRVGFGKGMYDRFFGSLSYRPNIIFLSKKAMVAKSVVTDSYDIFGDQFISNDCVIKRGMNDRIHSNRVYNIWFDCRK